MIEFLIKRMPQCLSMCVPTCVPNYIIKYVTIIRMRVRVCGWRSKRFFDIFHFGIYINKQDALIPDMVSKIVEGHRVKSYDNFRDAC